MEQGFSEEMGGKSFVLVRYRARRRFRDGGQSFVKDAEDKMDVDSSNGKTVNKDLF